MSWTAEQKQDDRQRRRNRDPKAEKLARRVRYREEKALWDSVLVRFDKEDGAALRLFTVARGISVAEAVRLLVTWKLEEL